MLVMRDHPENVVSMLVQSSFGTHQITCCTHPLLDHHQEEQQPLPHSGLALLLEVVETEWRPVARSTSNQHLHSMALDPSPCL